MRQIELTLLACACFLSGCVGPRETDPASASPAEKFQTIGSVQSVVVPVPSGGANLVGAGYDFLNGESKQFALSGQQPAPLLKVTSFPTAVTHQYQKVESQSSLARMLSFSAEASYGGFGSAEMDFVSNTKLNKFSLNYLFKLRVLTPPHMVASPELSEQAITLLRNRNYRDFYRLYGTHFYRSEIRGGSLYGLINVTESDSARTRSLNAQMKIGVGLFGSAADLKRELSLHTRSAKITVIGARFGGPPKMRSVFTTPEELEQAGRAFSSELDPQGGNDWTLALRAEPYSNCINYPVEALDYHDFVSQAVLARKDIDELLLLLSDSMNDIDYAQTHRIAAQGVSAFGTKINALSRDGDTLRRSIAANPFDESIQSKVSELRASVDTLTDSVRQALLTLQQDETTLAVSFDIRGLGGWRNLKRDHDMGTESGEKTRVTANLEPVIKNGKLYVQIEYKVEERKKDHSTFGGTKLWEVPGIPRNCKIVRLGRNNPVRYSKDIPGKKHSPVTVPTGGTFVELLKVRFDGPRDDDSHVRLWAKGTINVITVCD